MARGKPSRNVKPGPSNDAAGKLWAVCSCFEPKNSRDYLKAPFYFDACRSWYKALSWQQQETGSTVIDAYTSFGEITAERIAAICRRGVRSKTHGFDGGNPWKQTRGV